MNKFIMELLNSAIGSANLSYSESFTFFIYSSLLVYTSLLKFVSVKIYQPHLLIFLFKSQCGFQKDREYLALTISIEIKDENVTIYLQGSGRNEIFTVFAVYISFHIFKK